MAKKETLKERLKEGLLELILMLFFFAIGALVVACLGGRIDSSSLDGDLIVLIGIVAFLLLGGGVLAIVERIKEKRGENQNEK